ncbi:MAG TPA: FIST N-terminal domain-containing protein, partial [Anaerolineae bacterium]|nr:FIST N-terminal domain-containing protein [Anaerolineae bacterium]
MSNIGTSYTTLPDPRAAAAQLVEQARTGLAGKPTLAILFSTTDYDTEALVSSVQKELGDVPLWGGTSSTGVFGGDRWVTGEKGAAALMLIANRPAGVGVVPVGEDPVADGKTAATAA